MGCVIGLIIGCAYDRVIMSDSLNWIKNDEWFVSRLSILRMETAGIETITNIKKRNIKSRALLMLQCSAFYVCVRLCWQ